MKPSKKPLWKRSIVNGLGFHDVLDSLEEIQDNGDLDGYEREESGYYSYYEGLFNDLAQSAYSLSMKLDDDLAGGFLEEDKIQHWNDVVVAFLGGESMEVLGHDQEADEYLSLGQEETDIAVQEATKRLKRLTKDELLDICRFVLSNLVTFLDLKSAHDCLTAIVQELDEKGAILDKVIEDAAKTGTIDSKRLPPRMWVE